MSKTSRYGSKWALAVLAGFATTVFLIPVHLHHDAHHLIDHHEADARPVSDHGHEHDTPEHEHHSASDHEIVAVRSHDDAASPATAMAVLIDLPDVGTGASVTRFAVPDACGPPRRPETAPRSSRAPPAA